MPAYPGLSAGASSLRPSVFTTLASQFKTLPQPPIPLHLGDTYRLPPEAARIDRVLPRMPKDQYGYVNPNGLDELRAAVAQRCAGEGFTGLDANHVHVTAGGSNALYVTVATWVQPGDEVLVCAPYWPMIKGMIQTMGGVPIEVPFYPAVRRGDDLGELLSRYVTPRTVALYVTNPNNPCGTVLTPGQVQEVANFVQAKNLWAIADEAYHHYVYEGSKHVFLASLPGMSERTATIFTVSKSYALAGTRVGFIVGSPTWLDTSRRMFTHAVYNVPMFSQLTALAAIEQGEPWIAETRAIYAKAADTVLRTFDAEFGPAQGGGYVFADLGKDLAGKPAMEYLLELLREGVCISPGDAFGAEFTNHVRVCFTSVPHDTLEIAIGKMNRSLHRLRQAARQPGSANAAA